MIPEPGDANCEITVTETFYLQTNDELSDKELKQIEVDDQAIQTILLGLLEDIYAAVDSCKTAQEIWLRVRFTSNEGESIESYYHRFLKLMNDLKRNKHFPEKIASNLKFLNNLQPEWSRHNYLQQPMINPEDIIDPTTAMNMALALMAKAFKQNYSTPTNNNQRISSNPRNRQIAQPECRESGWNGLIGVQGNGNQNQIGNGNLVAARAEGNAAGQNGNQIRCYNCRGVGHYARNCIVRPKRRDAAYLQTQLLIAQKEDAEIQLQAEEYDLMADAADLDEIKKVNANCILMANLQQASTSGIQNDSALVYDSDGSAKVHENYDENCDENCDDNEIFNMFTQEEQYTELLEPILKSYQVPRNDNDIISEDTSVEQGGEIVEQHPVNFEETRCLYDSLYQNLATEVEKFNSVNRMLKETNADLTTELAKFKNQTRCFEMSQEKYDKLERCYQQSVYQEQCISKKINALHLSTESHEKMKQMNKEIKPVNYTKINHLSGVFVPQTALSHEELYFLNNSKTANVSKSISIPNEDFSDDTTPSVARKFLNEVKSTIVTLQCVVKQRITIETHNWSSSAHQELHKILRDEIFPIVNQVDARLQNFEIQFLKEAAKFVKDFKSLANEADASLAKHKALELGIERLLKAVDMQQKIEWLQAQLGDLKGKSKDTSCVSDTRNPLSQKLKNKNVELEFQVLNYARENAHLKATYKNLFDSISVSQTQTKTIIASLQNELQSTIYKNANLRTQLFKKVSDQIDNTQDLSENTKFAKQPIMENLPKIGVTNALSKPVTSNSVSTPQESKGVNNDKVISLRMFRINPSKSSREEKHVTNTVNNTKTRRLQPWSNTKHDRVPYASKSSRSKNKEAEVEENHSNLLLSKNNRHISSACNNIQIDSQDVISKVVCAMSKKCLISVDHDNCLRKYVNGKNSRGKKQKAKVSFKENQIKYQPQVIKPKKVESHKSLTTPKPRKSRLLLRWSPTGKLFDKEGKIVDSSTSKSQFDCSNGDNACTSNSLEPKIKRFPNSTSLLDSFDTINDLARNDLVASLPKFKYHKEHLCPSCEQGKSKRASHPPKPVPNSRQRLHLLHMDLCGPMRIPSINGKRKPDISFLYVFDALCYPKNDREEIGKLGAKATARTVPPAQEPQVR
uniref:Ribonuclease H-like domain-containing protein n=1 Tax=Tanacetum cinerariifolium TaxID=118510 RepID=A0A699HAZ2_TANCI|nr:ribonuclease H-like domain-containing protein [Tanacetum cinerariifolium]